MSVVATGLSFSYGERPALEGVGFAVRRGELVAVLGPNGAGKTTLFQCILGLRRRYAGAIAVDGRDARRMPAAERAARMAYVPQLHGDVFGYTAFEMVLMGTAHAVPPLSSPGRREIDAANAALRRLGVEGLAERRFASLSGGERQLVLIARALAQRADTLLMDEPTASLDYGNQSRVLSLVRELAGEGRTVLLSTHNPQHALTYAHRVLALSDGRMAAFGAPTQVITPSLIDRLYRVSARVVQADGCAFIVPGI
ncbi:MAG: ABC transporter ATP-binding protein [Clostridiales bacterium]|nr:ABC transporter ATP-binding protein [Clostridiales bacterium]